MQGKSTVIRTADFLGLSHMIISSNQDSIHMQAKARHLPPKAIRLIDWLTNQELR